MEEEWKDVCGFEGRYQISSYGRVRTVARFVYNRTQKEKIMTLRVHTNGYVVVWLRKPGTHKKYFVHRIVAEHFLEIVDGKDFVNHLDKDRTNNVHSNLEWCTHQENIKHRDSR